MKSNELRLREKIRTHILDFVPFLPLRAPALVDKIMDRVHEDCVVKDASKSPENSLEVMDDYFAKWSNLTRADWQKFVRPQMISLSDENKRSQPSIQV